MIVELEWTVYRSGELFDVMTYAEVAELMRVYDYVMIDLRSKVVEF
jgi:hypothetical protein